MHVFSVFRGAAPPEAAHIARAVEGDYLSHYLFQGFLNDVAVPVHHINNGVGAFDDILDMVFVQHYILSVQLS